MSYVHPPYKFAARASLLIACACWGLSLPLERALLLDQAHDHPTVSSWCLSAWGLCLRFALAAAILAVWFRGALSRPSRGEWSQGTGLGVLMAGGLLLQMDALLYAKAGTVAFLSQCYAVWIPLVLCVRNRCLPGLREILGITGVVAGIAFLAGPETGAFTLGRGEWEAILGSLVLTAQILLLERKRDACNRVEVVALISFVASALAFIPVVAVTAPSVGVLVDLYAAPSRFGLLVILAGVSTCLGLVLMYRWQRHVGATTAAIIYCTEPIYTAAFAIVLPAFLSGLLDIQYANELLTSSIIWGGSLILAANLIVQCPPLRWARPRSLRT